MKHWPQTYSDSLICAGGKSFNFVYIVVGVCLDVLVVVLVAVINISATIIIK